MIISLMLISVLIVISNAVSLDRNPPRRGNDSNVDSQWRRNQPSPTTRQPTTRPPTTTPPTRPISQWQDDLGSDRLNYNNRIRRIGESCSVDSDCIRYSSGCHSERKVCKDRLRYVGESCIDDSDCGSTSIGCHSEAKVCSECGYKITSRLIKNRRGADLENDIGDFETEGTAMTYVGNVCRIKMGKRCHPENGICGDMLQVGESCFRSTDCQGSMYCDHRGVCSRGADVGEACKFTIAGSYTQGLTRFYNNRFGNVGSNCDQTKTSGCMPLLEDATDAMFNSFVSSVQAGSYDGVCRGLVQHQGGVRPRCFNTATGTSDHNLCPADGIIYRKYLPGWGGAVGDFADDRSNNVVYVYKGTQLRTTLSDAYMNSLSTNKIRSETYAVGYNHGATWLTKKPDEWFHQIPICFDKSCGVNTKASDTMCSLPIDIGGQCCNDEDCYQLRGGVICFRDPELFETVMDKNEDVKKWSSKATTKVGHCSWKRNLGQTCLLTTDCKSSYECYKNVCHDHKQIDEYCTFYHDCDPILATPTAQDPSDTFFCLHNKCSRRLDEGMSCTSQNHCLQPKLACVDNICNPMWMFTNPKWKDELDAIVDWIGNTVALGGTTYCYRDAIKGRTCGPNQEQAGIACWDNCRNGWTGVGPWCWSGFSSYGRMSHGRDWLWWCDTPNYYHDALHCSRTCPPHQPHGCLAGCAVDGAQCASVTAGMIMGPVDIVLSFATLGTSTAVTGLVRGVKTAITQAVKVLNKFGKVGKKLKKLAATLANIAESENKLQLLNGFTAMKTAFDRVLHFYRGLSDHEIMDKHVRQIMDDHNCGPTHTLQFDSERTCWSMVKDKYAAGVASAIFLEKMGKELVDNLNHWLATQVKTNGESFSKLIETPSLDNIDGFLGTFMTFTNSQVLTALSIVDPTGILGTVAAYAHPRCKYPAAFPSFSINAVHTFLTQGKEPKPSFIYMFSDNNLPNLTTY